MSRRPKSKTNLAPIKPCSTENRPRRIFDSSYKFCGEKTNPKQTQGS